METFVVDPSRLGIPEGGDPIESALALLDEDPGFWALLCDLSRRWPLTVPSADAAAVLGEIGASLNGHAIPEGARRFGPKEDIVQFARQLIFVHGAGLEPLAKIAPKSWLVTAAAPANPEAWNHLVEVGYEGSDAVILIDGVETARTSVMSTRFPQDLLKHITRGLQGGPKGPVIALPDIADGLTTLDAELAFFDSQLRFKMLNYAPPSGSVPDAVLSILLSHTKADVEVSRAERTRLANLIGEFVKRGEPIPVVMLLILGCRVRNSLKFGEDIQAPTLAWAHLGFFFKLINEKVRKVYAPGINVIFFDEASLFGPMLMSISEEEVAVFAAAARRLFEKMGTPIEIRELHDSYFDPEELRRQTVVLNPAQVYAILCSLPEMTDREIMAPLYTVRDRDYAALRRMAGEMWDTAEHHAEVLNRYLAVRKSSRLFNRLVGDFVDACVTEKSERIVFDMMGNALPHHGMALVRRGEAGNYGMEIIPEYRLHSRHGVRPVRIPLREFGVDDDRTVIFYYEDTGQ